MKKLIAFVFALLLAAVGATLFVIRGGATPVKASEVVTRAQAAQAKLAASVGPNTTFHETVVTHEAKDVGSPSQAFYLPPDRVADTWVYFDATGTAHGLFGQTTGLDGKLYQQGLDDGTTLTIIEPVTGFTHVSPGAGSLTAAKFAQGLSAILGTAATLVQADAAAKTTTLRGERAYLITYKQANGVIVAAFNAQTYLEMREEHHDVDANGPITKSLDITHFEILPGNVVPKPAMLAGTPAAGVTPVGTVTPAAPDSPSGAATITVGVPTLVNDKVQIPVSTTGAGLAAYSGFSIHLRWDHAVFTYSSANSTSSVLPSPLICPAGVPDADGGGVIFACAAIGSGQTAAAGLLGTIVLTPTGTGCSVLHLFTYGAGDGGDGTTGTFLIDPSTADPEVLTTVDARVDQTGHPC